MTAVRDDCKKNMNIFRKKFKKVYLGQTKSHLLHFGHNKNLPQKICFIFLCLSNPNFMEKWVNPPKTQ